MSRKRRNDKSELNSLNLSEPIVEIGKSEENVLARESIWKKLKNPLHWWMIGVIAFLSLGAMGAGLKYLDENAQREIARRASNKGNLNDQDQSFINKVNPFLSPPDPPPTPQLSKEYIYAGSRLLAVEDKNATAAPPADLAIWRKTTGEWWVRASDDGLSHQVTQQWGASTDKEVPGDYDGDGKTDFAVWRPADGNWYIINSGGGGGQFGFGISTDITAQADYDGDGKTDAAVYRNGTWYIRQSSNAQTLTVQWGATAGDTPAPADYDGDGKADIAVWRDSNTTFYSLNSSNGALQSPDLGQSGEPVSADYDGDGKANFAVKSGANWVILNNTFTQIQTIPWQSSGDKPVQNDYDGDGKVDIAVWRNENGTWYIRNSSNPSQPQIVQWGAAGDFPVPAFYRR